MTSAPPAFYARVWARPVRVAHWCLATLICFDLFNDSGGKVHRYAGYAAAAVVALRLLYGIVYRSGPARLPLPKPSECWAHLREMLTGRVPRLAGHNPLGAAMTLLLWTLVLLLALTGWVSRWDRFWGEDWPQESHSWLSYILQLCVILHLLGVAVGSVLERQNLVRGMISGGKYVDTHPPPENSGESAD
jgi:cytochrome b